MTTTTPSALTLLTEGDIIRPGCIFLRPDGYWCPVDASSHGQTWNPDDFHPMAYTAEETP